jgi:hypothetical protein
MTRTRFGIFALVVTLMLFVSPSARASQGVKINLGAIAVDEHLVTGGSYELPAIEVTNPADEPTSYRMTVHAVADESRRVIPEGWVVMQPETFDLEAGKTQRVTTSLIVPHGSESGTYTGLLVAEIVTYQAGSRIGGAAGARLTFDVVAPASVWLDDALKYMDSQLAVIVVAGVLVLVLIAAVVFRRTFEIRLVRRR